MEHCRNESQNQDPSLRTRTRVPEPGPESQNQDPSPRTRTRAQRDVFSAASVVEEVRRKWTGSVRGSVEGSVEEVGFTRSASSPPGVRFRDPDPTASWSVEQNHR
ncbi:hypothetical protein EYF80_045998 [Liparis tanakae]|uniref:Uncharacterized protein n=1 Tax=Liparis tanakae TaxID=230148 RepID=A0A4Z2FTX3_9TELE|nr:hypothetical protein EYF80_045998 [Liparis tanakae]